MKTKDYSLFSFFDNNRPVDAGKLKELTESMEIAGFISSKPITVNTEHKIIDGQHRFMVAMELGLPVEYNVYSGIVSDGDLMILLNRNQSSWNVGHYIHHYATNGVPFHKEIVRFMEEYKLGLTGSLSICGLSDGKSDKIREGENLKLYNKRNACAEYILAMKNLPFYKSSKFIRSVRIFFDKSTDTHKIKLLKRHLSLTEQVSISAYLNSFSNIVNRNVSEVNKFIY